MKIELLDKGIVYVGDFHYINRTFDSKILENVKEVHLVGRYAYEVYFNNGTSEVFSGFTEWKEIREPMDCVPLTDEEKKQFSSMFEKDDCPSLGDLIEMAS